MAGTNKTDRHPVNGQFVPTPPEGRNESLQRADAFERMGLHTSAIPVNAVAVDQRQLANLMQALKEQSSVSGAMSVGTRAAIDAMVTAATSAKPANDPSSASPAPATAGMHDISTLDLRAPASVPVAAECRAG